MTELEPTARTARRRHKERGSYDPATGRPVPDGVPPAGSPTPAGLVQPGRFGVGDAGVA